jgi:hypothetical protein
MKHLKTLSTGNAPSPAIALLEKTAIVQNIEQTVTQLTAFAGILRNLKNTGSVQ